MSIIGEAVLTVTMEILFKKLASEVLPLFGRQEKIRGDLEDWQRKLRKIKAVLDDAEDKQMRDETVKDWLGDLKNLAYDVEDVLDEFATEALRRNLLQNSDQPSTSRFQKLIPTCCTNLTPRSLEFDSKIRRNIDDISRRLQNITAEKDQLGLELKENSGGRSKNSRKRRQETTCFVIEAEVHGREEEKKAIVELLLKDDLSPDHGGLSVIPITGMGGLGKTTLAQLVYNDKTVDSHFDLKVWTCVSEDFDATRITKSILKSIGVQTTADDNLNLLQGKLKRELSRKKFLLILDDMWNENYDDWSILKLPLADGTPGSKIIVTTRSQTVALKMGTIPAYPLRELSNDDALLVLTQHSLGTRDFSKHQYLREIGTEIVKRCHGLPLAAKALGGLLRGKYNPSDWEKVLKNKIWDLPEEGSDIMRALKVSYYYLPAHLKRCFAYSSLFPKDYEFNEQEIVLLWMAEGLLPPDVNEKRMEESGNDYFKELQSRSFFQQSNMNTSRYVMHDFINDLAQWAAGDIYFRMDDIVEGSKQPKLLKHVRHLSYIIKKWHAIRSFEAISGAEHLRTFLPIELTESNRSMSLTVVNMLLKLQRLRFLSLRGYYISEIPNSICNLKHLRHLDVSGTPIETLPESTNTLYNLHVLLMQNCNKLKRLCADMGNLIKLHHRNNFGADSLEEMALGIGRLTGLQTLRYFVVGKNNGSRLTELKYLKNLSGKLKISSLENVKDVADAKEAELHGKGKLNELCIEWANSNDNSRDLETETSVFYMLRPHGNLKELTVKGYGGSNFPVWLGDSMFSNLVLLRFENCSMCTSLPMIGQLPSLKHLFIIGITRLKSLGLEFHGNKGSVAFSSLETLYFRNLPEWEEWIQQASGHGVEVFPQLRELSLIRCSKLLGRLPECVPLLKRLVIRECEQLVVSIPSIPTLCKLEIDRCKKVAWRSTTVDPRLSKSLVSSDMSEQVFPTGLLKQELPNLEDLEINTIEKVTYLWQTEARLLQDIGSLRQLKIARCPELLSLVAEEAEYQQQQVLECRLNCLELSYCQSLVKLPQALLSLRSVKRIKISECRSLHSLPEAWMHSTNISLESLTIDCCDSLTYISRQQLPPSLKRMMIFDCKNLTTLIDEGQVSTMEAEDINSGSSMYSSLLQDLTITDCPSLTSLLSKGELSATLEQINVKRSSKLASLSSRRTLSKALRYLTVLRCSKLESIGEGLANISFLEKISVWDCKNLKVLPDNLHEAIHLERLKIFLCPNLVSFPRGGLPRTKLTYLYLCNCEKLQALPNNLRNVTSLQQLAINNCPSIEYFPEDGFPTDLCSLEIDYLNMYKPLFGRGLHRFSSVTQLSLSGEGSDVVSFPPADTAMALPASLTKLSIDNFPNLERLSSTVGNLTSLEILRLSDCPKLKYFPEKGLPHSLLNLQITGCPLIKERCKKDKGQYWHLIADIPYVGL